MTHVVLVDRPASQQALAAALSALPKACLERRGFPGPAVIDKDWFVQSAKRKRALPLEAFTFEAVRRRMRPAGRRSARRRTREATSFAGIAKGVFRPRRTARPRRVSRPSSASRADRSSGGEKKSASAKTTGN